MIGCDVSAVIKTRARAAAMAFALCLAAPVMADDATPPDITLNRHGHGWILTNAKGMSLYTFSRDQEPGKSACLAQCAEQWPPALATIDVTASGDWSTIKRPDGSRQWAFRGRPLYAYAGDQNAGEAFGDGMNNTWALALKPITTPPGIMVAKSRLGHVLADGRRLTLYTSDSDSAGTSVCDARCAATWKIVAAPWTAKFDAPDWSVVVRKDGTKQWAYKGKPLYTFERDVTPGEAFGDGVEGRHAVILEAPPANPPWVTYQLSDGGMLLADAKGITLYMHDMGRRAGMRNGGIQRPDDWAPVIAKADDLPVGNWGIADHNGVRQWTHKGLFVYTNVRDRLPGDLHGVRNTDAVWRTIMRSGETMDGTGF